MVYLPLVIMRGEKSAEAGMPKRAMTEAWPWTNPTKTIQLSRSFSEIKSVEIYNLLGQKIQDWKFSNQYQPDYLLQISDVRTGTYVVKVATDKGIIFKNVLIKE